MTTSTSTTQLNDGHGIILKDMARSITMTCVHHIKERIDERDTDYIKMGLDNTFSQFDDFFKTVTAKLLGTFYQSEYDYPTYIIHETMSIIYDDLMKKGYSSYLSVEQITNSIYEICQSIMQTVKEENFAEEYVN